MWCEWRHVQGVAIVAEILSITITRPFEKCEIFLTPLFLSQDLGKIVRPSDFSQEAHQRLRVDGWCTTGKDLYSKGDSVVYLAVA